MTTTAGSRALPPALSAREIDVVVVGCGGTGSALCAGLAHLHNSMRALGHPGLHVTVVDGDTVSSSNSVRQPFSANDVGQGKAALLVSRINHFWGLAWEAMSVHLEPGHRLASSDLVISCVDTRRARRTVRTVTERQGCGVTFVLDTGNDATTGQVVLGEPANPHNRNRLRARRRRDAVVRLPCSWDLFPEIVDPALDADDGPSCSALESLTRQAPGVNATVATYALALLAQLFCAGGIDRHGGFLDAAAGTATPLPIDPATWARFGYAGERGQRLPARPERQRPRMAPAARAR